MTRLFFISNYLWCLISNICFHRAKSLTSLSISINTNPLNLCHDQIGRQKIVDELNGLLNRIQEQKKKKKPNQVFDLPPMVKQIIRCLHPSDINNKIGSEKPTISLSLHEFIELFRI